MDNKIDKNEDINNLKAIMINWVLFIHCLYWLGLFEGEPYITLKSLLLFEMPLCFFVAGVSNSYSQKSTLDFLIGRLNRILPLYWGYSIICIILISDQVGFTKGIILSWINPFRDAISGIENLQYLNWALWFIPVYIIVICLFPIYRKVFKYLNKNTISQYFVLTSLGFLILYKEKLGFNAFISQVIFYTFWVYEGMIFHGRKKYNKKFSIAIITISLALLLFLVMQNIFTLNMQTNKGECNFAFLLYSIIAMNFLYLVYPFIKKILQKMYKNAGFKWYWNQCTDNSYFIYLFHPLIFAFIPNISNLLGVNNLIFSNSIVTILIYFIMVSICTAFMANWYQFNIKRKVLKKG